eukprot:TRINITY_DN16479_c0_g4_i1.p1 TRINITY_DN16479_c0_g4~~TRINITY_DN16479_c0_g4_i1.p1  ORF type:complete len:1200 (+),score=152.57 TRINITY_DN16479_c0_g4_i1:172-3600(+)
MATSKAAEVFIGTLLNALEAKELAGRTFSNLHSQVLNASIDELGNIACSLSLVIFQLRTWYTEEEGTLLLLILERIANIPGRLGSFGQARIAGGLAVLRLLEGLVLVCTVRHSQKKVTDVLLVLLRGRHLPPYTSARLEATLVCLDGNSSEKYNVPPQRPLNWFGDNGELWLNHMAVSLEPTKNSLYRVDLAKIALERAVSLVFDGARVDYFGSAVNGFDTVASDVDCVIQLDEAHINLALGRLSNQDRIGACEDSHASGGRQRRKEQASAIARHLAKALKERGELQALQVHVKEVISEARVPLLKCHSAEGVDLDITFNNVLPLYNSRLLRAYADFDPRIRSMGRLVKCWAKRRRVNDALEGTLSSYTYMLLVIHFLQHVGVAPNLQDKQQLSGAHEKVTAGVHDVWFLDPSANPEVVMKESKKDATLCGLLARFFRYFAYEFPWYSEIVSIRSPTGRHVKVDYFQASAVLGGEENTSDLLGEAAGQKASDVEEEADVVVAAPPGIESDAESSGSEALEFAGFQKVESSQDLQSTKTPCRGLSPHEMAKQRLLSQRQMLCVEDPFEVGRTLGVSFQGMERLAYELRRACSLIGENCSEKQLEELFSDDPPPAKSVWKLLTDQKLQSVLSRGAPQGWPSTDATRKPIADKQSRAANFSGVAQQRILVRRDMVARVIGTYGSTMKELQRWTGVDSVCLDENGPPGTPVTLIITGSSPGVSECGAYVEKILGGRSRGNGGSGVPTKSCGLQHMVMQPQKHQPPAQHSVVDKKSGVVNKIDATGARLWAPGGNTHGRQSAHDARERGGTVAGGGDTSHCQGSAVRSHGKAIEPSEFAPRDEAAEDQTRLFNGNAGAPRTEVPRYVFGSGGRAKVPALSAASASWLNPSSGAEAELVTEYLDLRIESAVDKTGLGGESAASFGSYSPPPRSTGFPNSLSANVGPSEPGQSVNEGRDGASVVASVVKSLGSEVLGPMGKCHPGGEAQSPLGGTDRPIDVLQTRSNEDRGEVQEPKVKAKSMKSEELKPFLGKKIQMKAKAKCWDKGEIAVIEGGSESSWKLVTERLQHFTVRKDNEDVGWSWVTHQSEHAPSPATDLDRSVRSGGCSNFGVHRLAPADLARRANDTNKKGRNKISWHGGSAGVGRQN